MMTEVNERLPGYRGLQQADEKYKAVISALCEGIVIMTREGIQESNASADRILGLHIDGQEGCVAEDSSIELFRGDGSPLPRPEHPCYITLATGHSFDNVIVGFRRPGEAITWCSLNTRPLWTEGGPLPDTVVASVRDVTRDLEMQARIEQARLDAERRACDLQMEQERLTQLLNELHVERELRESFVASLTHDLRTPLTVAMYGAQRLMKQSDDPVRKGAERILGSVRRLDQMVRDLLDANRIRAGQGLPLDKQRCSLRSVIDQACDSLEDISGNRLRVEGDDLPEINVCSKSLQRVVENLISNALKYGNPESAVTVSLMRTESCARMEVHNFGEPIADTDQKVLFEPYRRPSALDSRQAGSWGLGLFLVKGIVEAHQGSIYVRSSRETGTRFIVDLPCEG